MFTGRINKAILLLCIVGITHVMEAQTYYGKHGIGKMELMDDSTILAYFVDRWIPDKGSFEELSYSKSGDMIILNSATEPRAKIDTCLCDDSVVEDELNHVIPVIAKVFLPKGELIIPADYYLAYEEIAFLDTMTKKVKVSIYYQEDAIVVINAFGFYCRAFLPGDLIRLPSGGECHAVVDISGSFTNHGLFFKDFPLRIKGKRLVPADSLKNFQCWIENGFYFPIMKKTRKRCTFEYPTAEWNIGLNGLPGIFPFQVHSLSY